MGVEKMSVSFDLELGEAIRRAATDEQQSVSAWLASAARDRLRLVAIGNAVEQWERKFGTLSDEEIRQADELLDRSGSKTKRKVG